LPATPDTGKAAAKAAPLVLVVDDDEDIRDALSVVLGSEGYLVVCAMHGAQALERLRECRPALIILDQMMPVMDGAAFIAAKNLDPSISKIPVLAITASMQPQVEGATAFMRKPVDLDCLLAAVARCVAS
jgi:CheY-like chemotaxis protein